MRVDKLVAFQKPESKGKLFGFHFESIDRQFQGNCDLVLAQIIYSLHPKILVTLKYSKKSNLMFITKDLMFILEVNNVNQDMIKEQSFDRKVIKNFFPFFKLNFISKNEKKFGKRILHFLIRKSKLI